MNSPRLQNKYHRNDNLAVIMISDDSPKYKVGFTTWVKVGLYQPSIHCKAGGFAHDVFICKAAAS